jgi:LmbE family N-acetylglucosaminyl deacetylase
LKFEKEHLLIIAPHADDEILGCYSLINKIKKGGGKVSVQILTLGGYPKMGGGKIKKEIWKNEFLKTMKFLKIDSFDIAYYDDEIRHLDTIPQSELIELLEVKSPISISKIKPTIVAIPTIFSTHQDHVQAYKVSMTALRENPQKIHKLPHMVVSYESPEYHHSEFGRFSPDYYLSLSKLDVDKKVKCLNIYQSQIREGHRDGEKIYSLAKIRGSEIGSAFAESYHIHRFFIQ